MNKNYIKHIKKMVSLLLILTLLLTDTSFAASRKKPYWKKKISKLTVGQSFTFKAKKMKKSHKIIYRSSNKKIASINKKNGKCKAKKAGKVKIKAIIRNKKGKKIKTLSTTLRVYKDNTSGSAVSGKSSSSGKNSSSSDKKQETTVSAPIIPVSPSPSPAVPSASPTPSPSNGNPASPDTGNNNGTSSSQDTVLKKVIVTEASTLNNWNLTVRLTLNQILVEKDLQNTSVQLMHAANKIRLTANFKNLEKDGCHAVYQISTTDSHILKPGNRSMNGSYSISSADLQCATGLTTDYEEALKGNTIQGFICDTFYQPLEGVSVSLENGESTLSDENGFYCLYSEKESVTLIAAKTNYTSETLPDISLDATKAVVKNLILGNHKESELSCQLHITDESGSSLSDIPISLFNKTGTLLGTGFSDGNGNLIFSNDTTAVPTSSIIVPSDEKLFFNRTDSYTIKAEKNPSSSNPTHTYKTSELTFSFADTPFPHITKELMLSHNEPVSRIPFRISWEAAAWNSLNTSTPTLLVDFLDRDGITSLLKSPVTTTLRAEEVNHSVLLELVEDTTLFFEEAPCLPDGIYYLRLKDFSSKNGEQINATTIVPIEIIGGKRTPIKEAVIKPASSVQVSATVSDIYSLNSLHFLSPGMPATTIRDAMVQESSSRNDTDTIVTKYYLYEKINGLSVLVDTFHSSPFIYQITNNKKQVQSTTLLSKLEANKEYYLTAPDSYASLNTKISVIPTASQIKNYSLSHTSCASIGEIRISPEAGDALEACGNHIAIDYIQISGENKQTITKIYPKSSYAYRTESGDFSITPSDDNLYGTDLAAGVKNENPKELFAPFSALPTGKYEITVKLENCAAIKTLSFIELIDFEKASVTITDRVSYISDTVLTGSITKNGFPMIAPEGSSNAQTAGTIMLYDADGKIAAGKDIPSGTTRYTLTDGVDGHFTDGLYHLVVRGNQIETFDDYISIRKETTNRLDIALVPGGRASLQVSFAGIAKPSTQKERALCLQEKDTFKNLPGNWSISNDYRELTYTGEYIFKPSDNVSIWLSDSVLPMGTYLLTALTGYYQPITRELQIADKNVSMNLNMTLPENTEKDTISYTFSLPPNLYAEGDTLLWAELYDSTGNRIDLKQTTYADAAANGISLFALQKEEQTVRLYLHGHLLFEQTITI